MSNLQRKKLNEIHSYHTPFLQSAMESNSETHSSSCLTTLPLHDHDFRIWMRVDECMYSLCLWIPFSAEYATYDNNYYVAMTLSLLSVTMTS